jgi:uncharacterized protein (AIM24 family)
MMLYPDYGTITFAPFYPAKIFPIDLDDNCGRIIAEWGSFILGDERVQLFVYHPGVDMEFRPSFGCGNCMYD